MEDLARRARTAAVALLAVCAACGPRTSEPARGQPAHGEIDMVSNALKLAADDRGGQPAHGEIDMVSNALKLAADDRGWSITFVLQNTTAREMRGTILEPIAGFSLEVRSETGDPLPLAQPALDIPGRPRALVLAPGAAEQLQTPIHLRFDPAVPPSGGDDPMVWSIRSAPVPVMLRATLEVSGMPVQVAEARLVPGDTRR